MSKLAALSTIDLLGRSEKRHRMAETLLKGSVAKGISPERGGRMSSLGMKATKKSLGDMDRSGILSGRSGPVKQMSSTHSLQSKVAFIGGLMSAAKTVGQNLPGALRVAGVGKRMAIGAGAGAVGGLLTSGEGKRMSGALGGAAMGAAGGALSHGGFRKAVMGKGLTPSPAGTTLMKGATKSFDVPKSAVKVSHMVGYAKQADLSYDNATSHAGNAMILGGLSGTAGRVAFKGWGHSPIGNALSAVAGGVSAFSGVESAREVANAGHAAQEGRLFPSKTQNSHPVREAAGSALDVGVGHLIGGRSGKVFMAGGILRGAAAAGRQFGHGPSRGDRPASSIKDDGDSPIQPRNSKDVADK